MGNKCFFLFLGKALSIVTNCCSLFFCPWYDPFFRAGCQLGTERRRTRTEEKEENRERPPAEEKREREKERKEEKGEEWLFTRLTGHTGHTGHTGKVRKIFAYFSNPCSTAVIKCTTYVDLPRFRKYLDSFLRYVPAIFCENEVRGNL